VSYARETVHFGTTDRALDRACPKPHAGDAIPHTRAAQRAECAQTHRTQRPLMPQ
jgi:hypothetical protein